MENAGSRRWRRDAERRLHSKRDASTCRSVATPVCHIILERAATHCCSISTVRLIDTKMQKRSELKPIRYRFFLQCTYRIKALRIQFDESYLSIRIFLLTVIKMRNIIVHVLQRKYSKVSIMH